MSRIVLKPIADQVIIITVGDRIGLTTARMLARQGAALFLVAGNRHPQPAAGRRRRT